MLTNIFLIIVFETSKTAGMKQDENDHNFCITRVCLVRCTSMPCLSYKPGLFTAQACSVRRNTFRLVIKTRTYVWACTYVRIGLHIRMYRPTRTYVQSTPSPHQVASPPSPFILSFWAKTSINQTVKNDSTSPHDPFSYRHESFHICPGRFHTMLPLRADEGRMKGG